MVLKKKVFEKSEGWNQFLIFKIYNLPNKVCFLVYSFYPIRLFFQFSSFVKKNFFFLFRNHSTFCKKPKLRWDPKNRESKFNLKASSKRTPKVKTFFWKHKGMETKMRKKLNRGKINAIEELQFSIVNYFNLSTTSNFCCHVEIFCSFSK